MDTAMHELYAAFSHYRSRAAKARGRGVAEGGAPEKEEKKVKRYIELHYGGAIRPHGEEADAG